ncbi:MAG: bifunctional ADP-dependent NAD(P)H-hydrate dehydratase/NAD(P)H-hydrate epimerase [Flavobacteriaceae bacterium]|nr:MAG: bifunctional ADP-dependent NAD(P)H-hydrate dehydratase/NAD(P)H-hydrate epimerase [Flavobacteriaceae bacterium]
MKILNPEEIKAADQATIALHEASYLDLMEHAGTRCFNWLDSLLQGNPLKIHVFCGVGNNGGDGLVMARHLINRGYNVSCYIVNFSDKRTPEFLENYNRLKDEGNWPLVIKHEQDFPELLDGEVVIDAIFGIGLNKTPKGFTKKLIQHINSVDAFRFSVDIPSGLFAEKSVTDPEAVVKASYVITFETPKLAFFLAENEPYVMDFEIIGIGLDDAFIDDLPSKQFFILKDDVIPMYKPRKRFSHKGSFGHSLIIGGSFGKMGAVNFAVNGALKIGSGLVTAYIPKCGYSILQMAIPEAMVEIDAEEKIEFFNPKTNATVIGIGIGMGTDKKTIKGFGKFLKQTTVPMVIDADALNCLALAPSLLKEIPAHSVLTPHPKELERLLGKTSSDFEQLEKAIAFSEKYDVVIVLKGAYSKIIYKDQLYVNSSGNPALATGGSGDVLTGMITGLIAQGYTSIDAAVFAVYLHGSTADLAIEDMVMESFTASTIVDFIGEAMKDILTPDSKEELEKELMDEFEAEFGEDLFDDLEDDEFDDDDDF